MGIGNDLWTVCVESWLRITLPPLLIAAYWAVGIYICFSYDEYYAHTRACTYTILWRNSVFHCNALKWIATWPDSHRRCHECTSKLNTRHCLQWAIIFVAFSVPHAYITHIFSTFGATPYTSSFYSTEYLNRSVRNRPAPNFHSFISAPKPKNQPMSRMWIVKRAFYGRWGSFS